MTLNCKKGCCLEEAKNLAEQLFETQDRAFNILSEDCLHMINFIHMQVIPYLEHRANNGDQVAKDLSIDAGCLLHKLSHN